MFFLFFYHGTEYVADNSHTQILFPFKSQETLPKLQLGASHTD